MAQNSGSYSTEFKQIASIFFQMFKNVIFLQSMSFIRKLIF